MENNGSDISKMIDREIDLLEYITIILRNKYRIIFISFTMAIMAFISSSFMAEKYVSVVQVALVVPENLGGMSPDNRRAPEVMTLVEHGFVTSGVKENFQHQVLAKMRSLLFTEYFIKKNNLIKYIYNKNWDADNNIWLNDFKPNMLMAAKIFKRDMVSINVNDESGLIGVRVTWSDPEKAAMIANIFVAQFNEYMRNLEISEAEVKEAFLINELNKSKIIEIHKSIYRLMEAQLVIKMLASSKLNYSFEVLDPAVPAFEKSSPAKKKITILTLIGGIFGSVAFLIAKVVLLRMRDAIKQYQVDVEEIPATSINNDNYEN